ncbi:MAG: electron transport complex subunit RsxC [Oscillospiraceae bacterium]|nr:electron transport complex subunit RsxC [Oscillospiraceae bacterium]
MNVLQRLLSGGGVRVPHHKDTANYPTEHIPLPKKIVLPMSQHVGAPCEPCVKKGVRVYVGTMVGRAPSAMSMHIFSSVSGKVTAVEPILYKAGRGDMVVIIETDGLQTVDPSITPPDVHDRESFIAALEVSGIVGMGGAGFPTDIKVTPKNLSEIDTLIINGAECEPYLTTDNREFLECPDSILFGIRSCLKWLGIPSALICIEDNKPAAIDLMTRKTEKDPQISVKVLESRYPQGAQNVLIKNATGRIVPRGARHTSVGVMMLNVTTVSSIGKFLETGMPLVTKRLTVAGDAIENPKNLEVPIGVSIDDVVNYCGTTEEAGKIIIGGPMMGEAQMDVNYPITRQNNGVLVFGKKSSARPIATPCIRCGRCVNSCPMGLCPVDIRNAYVEHNAQELDRLMADLCIGCGTCSYVCPAKRPLAPTVTLAKTFLKTHSNREKR